MKIQQIRDPFSSVTSSGSGGKIIIFIVIAAFIGYTYYSFFYQPQKK
jgi:hypothetical protein